MTLEWHYVPAFIFVYSSFDYSNMSVPMFSYEGQIPMHDFFSVRQNYHFLFFSQMILKFSTSQYALFDSIHANVGCGD